jgi:hypothetical protein
MTRDALFGADGIERRGAWLELAASAELGSGELSEKK